MTKILHYFKWKLTTNMLKLCCECSVQYSAKHVKNYARICITVYMHIHIQVSS